METLPEDAVSHSNRGSVGNFDFFITQYGKTWNKFVSKVTRQKEKAIMASKNSLLGSGIHEPTPAPFGHGLINVRAPAWRFHATLCPKGRIVQFDAELDKLDAEGWVDHIGKTKRLPGLEKIWDNYQASLKHVEEEIASPVIPVEIVLTEDAIKANELKAESDRIEAKRIADLEKEQAGPPTCDLCGKEFDTEKAMGAHKRLAHKEK